jgi:hypothetical protein
VWKGRRNRECEERWIWSMYFTYLYENRTMKFVEIVIRVKERWGGIMRGETHQDIL